MSKLNINFKDRIFPKNFYERNFFEFFGETSSNVFNKYKLELYDFNRGNFILDKKTYGIDRNHELVIFAALRKLTKSLDHPPSFLEIGTYAGSSLIPARVANKDSRIITIDIKDPILYKSQDKKSREYIKKVRTKNVKSTKSKLFLKDSLSFEWERFMPYDLILIDGDHSIPRVDIDIYNAFKFINKNGIIIIDDIQEFSIISFLKGVITDLRLMATKELIKEYDYKIKLFPKTFGLRNLSPQTAVYFALLHK